MPNILQDMYEIYGIKRDSLYDISVANNAVMQGKLDQATAEITKMNGKLAAQQAVATKYYQAIDSVISIERTEETDDTIIQS